MQEEEQQIDQEPYECLMKMNIDDIIQINWRTILDAKKKGEDHGGKFVSCPQQNIWDSRKLKMIVDMIRSYGRKKKDVFEIC